MSLYKGAGGIYECDVRVVGVGRWHGSMATRKKAEAQPRYDAVKRLFREAVGPNGAERRALIDQLRVGLLPIERLASMVAGNEALVPAVPLVADLTAEWPTVDAAIVRYIDWMQVNPNKQKATWEHARSALRRFADFTVDEKRLGDRALDEVTSAHVEAYQKSLIDAKASANTVSGYIVRVGALWSWMQRKENRAAIETRRTAAVIHSPLDPEIASREQVSRDRWLTKDEAQALLAVVPDRLRLAVAAGLFGGFRIGEILTLRTHADIDLDLGIINVTQKQIGVDRDGAPIIWKPKTRRSWRVVPIASDLRPILEEHIARFSSSDWLMPAMTQEGVPFPYETFAKHFSVVVVDAGMIAGREDPRGVTFHCLRHTFASWLIMSGQVDLYTLAQLLGDTLQVVEDTYAHLAPDFKRRAIDAIKGTVTMTRAGSAVQTTATESATMEPVSV